ncbi:PD-(D/E)XK nuclease family protein [Alicyclobacillus tolerans]|uniref:ATP-dependent helicase/nuclease subunit B n=1 Tax=Alicyclobacillus tolerans TaxID=90970 RepID=A0ABT9LSR5_9BACL|nr:PD-(D/E)XK nuclease family protein [Alicyclobacillus tengchongensis]MDP9727306.1 ATP-dependent helicase/nuclease subunit B [Alicyclobacillus tengchongensis]
MTTIELWIGPAGSGKTEELARVAAEQQNQFPFGPPVYWITPTAVAFVAEQQLLSTVKAATRVQVLPWERFVETLFLRSGKKPPRFNQTGRRLLLRQVYEQVAPSLHLLRRVQPSISYLDAILAVFEELTAYGAPLHRMDGWLESAATELASVSHRGMRQRGQLLLDKLRELTILYRGYQSALNHLGETQFSEVIPLIKEASWIQGGKFYFDGFLEWTPAMLAVLQELAEKADDIVITLQGDERFFLSKEVQAELDKVRKGEIPLHSLMDTLLSMPEETAWQWLNLRSLLLMEDAFTAERVRFRFFSDKAENRLGEVMSYNSVTEELYAVAGRILQLAVEKDANFSDIAVVLPRMDEYQAQLERIFSLFQIPYNLDVFSKLSSHPLVRYLISSLQCFQYDFSYESMLNWGPAEFSGMSDEMLDRLKSYIETYRVSGQDIWFCSEPWRFASFRESVNREDFAAQEDARMDELRRRVVERLTPLAVFRQAELTPHQAALAIWDFLNTSGAGSVMAQWITEPKSTEELQVASQHEQAWDKLISLLDNLHVLSTEHPISNSSLQTILLTHLQEEPLAGIPAGLNRVLVTTYERARSWRKPYVFVLGCHQKNLPAQRDKQKLLQDEDRLLFYQLFHHSLGWTSKEQRMASQEEVYQLMTRASCKTTFTWSRFTEDGSETSLSNYLHPAFCKAYCHLQIGVTKAEKEHADVAQTIWLTPNAAQERLFRELSAASHGESIGSLPSLLEWYIQQSPDGETEKWQGFRFQLASKNLPEELMEKLCGSVLETNAHAIESYYACPYQHFSRFILRLPEPRLSLSRDARERGNLLHEVLSVYTQKFTKSPELWQSLTREQSLFFMEETLQQVLHTALYSVWESESLKQANLPHIRKVLELVAELQSEASKYSSFRPVLSEASFGMPNEAGSIISPLQIVDEQGRLTKIRGRVDRVEVDPARQLFRVIDFKTGKKKMDFNLFFHGLQLQLPLYGLVLEKASQDWWSEPLSLAALHYQPLHVESKLLWVPEDTAKARQSMIQSLRSSGWIKGDKKVVEALDRRLMQGAATPLFTKVMTKKEEFDQRAPIFLENMWDWMKEHAIEKVSAFSREVRQGSVAVTPYRLPGGQMACRYCNFQPLCHFEPHHHGNVVRRLSQVTKSSFFLDENQQVLGKESEAD